jgi:hypothetical protein
LSRRKKHKKNFRKRSKKREKRNEKRKRSFVEKEEAYKFAPTSVKSL